MHIVIDAYNAILPQLIELGTDAIQGAGLPSYAQLTRSQIRGLVEASHREFQKDLIAGTSQQFADFFEVLGPQRAHQGAQVGDMLTAIERGLSVGSAVLIQRFADDAAAQAWWYQRLHQIVYPAAIVLSKVFVVVREQLIRDQASQLREVSTPIIPIYRGILVLPLIGSVDSLRAGQIMEALLDGITRYQADVVIVDVTGVPVVDTGVANYLLQAAQAASLLGSQVILVGIGPEIAQTIVQLGVNLAAITTRANLEAGVTYALSLAGLAIQRSATTTAARLLGSAG